MSNDVFFHRTMEILLHQYSQTKPQLHIIANYFGFKIITGTFHNNETAYVDGESETIIINGNDTFIRQRWATAFAIITLLEMKCGVIPRENIYHYAKDYNVDNNIEKNIYVSRLLIPAATIERSMRVFKTIESFSDYYQVSKTAALYRLERFFNHSNPRKNGNDDTFLKDVSSDVLGFAKNMLSLFM